MKKTTIIRINKKSPNQSEWVTIDNEDSLLIAMEQMRGTVYKLKVEYENQNIIGKTFTYNHDWIYCIVLAWLYCIS